MERSSFEKLYDQNQERFVSEWKELLRFQSISTDPKHNDDSHKCAAWLVEHLKKLGVEASLWPTVTKPVVYGERAGKKGKPTVLFYGHYDVQPVDPIEKWTVPPFEPTLKEGRMYARGAQDNKGQLFYFVKAVEQLIKNDLLDCTLKILIEGEEESGGEGINDALPRWADKIKADVVMVCDTGTIHEDYAAITMGLRGIDSLEIKLSGPLYDLHSGVHGGVILNPATEIARLVATLHNPDGSIAIPGYYDGIPEIDAEDRKLANAAPFDLAGYEKQIGAPPTGGEQRFTPVERRGFRPTIEINGIHSGYGGPGHKTIIPSSAIAKISTRLVKGQDPARCMKLLIEHCKKNAPSALRFEVVEQAIGGPAVSLSAKSALVKKARAVLDEISGGKTIFIWEGASIPIVSALAEYSGGEPLLIGFGCEEDSIHAPNESFSLGQFRKGFLYAAMMLQSLSQGA